MKTVRQFFNPFTWKLAYRDALPQWKSLLLYTTAVIAGVAALVAIMSFRNDVFLTVDDQARELLGADIEFRATQPFGESVEAFLDSLQGEQSEAIEFNSMVQFLSSGDSRLSQIRAIDGNFPFYGSITTEPEQAALNYQDDTSALVEQSAMRQFGVSAGDSIRVGRIILPISGELKSVSGESAAFSFVGPRIYIPAAVLEGSGLLDRGSRVVYKRYYKADSNVDINEIISEFRPIGREHSVRTETVESRKQDFEAIVDNLSKFLGLIAFIALLLGGLGVASAVYVYIKGKTNAIATLRCIGMEKEKILATFFIQIAIVGFIGSAIGTGFGLMIQNWLPYLFAEFLPFEIVQAVSVQAVLLGLVLGTAISVGFSLLPLIAISSIPPMLSLRSSDFSPLKNLSLRIKITALIITSLVLILLIAFVTDSLVVAVAFAAIVLVSVAILWAVAVALTYLVKGLRLKSLTYVWRQGVANLFRPNNQTPLLLTTIGMGMLLIGTLYLSQEMLLNRISIESDAEIPNLVLYDIQMDQNEGVNQILKNEGAELMQNVPIVSMRLSSRKGQSISEARADTNLNIRNWALTREYRVTYRSVLNDSETLVSGEWTGTADGIESIVPISISEQIRDELAIEVGDTLGFNVQGVPVTTVVGSIRDVDFQRPEPNFFVVFPEGVLESAPQFYATTAKTESEDKAYALQQAVVSEYPNISIVDISVALATVQEFMDKIALAIQFMALFSIITGLIVLASSISISRKQRTHESVLIRTLGGTKKQIGAIQTIEYVLLGVLATLTGLILSIGISWILAVFYFDLTFIPDFTALILFSFLIVLAAVVIGWSGSRGVFKKSPNEILRMQIS